MRLDPSAGTGLNGRRLNGSTPSTGPRYGDATSSKRNLRSGHDGLDRQAIAAAKRGDWDGIHYLYARYADDVYAYVQSIVRDHHQAEDITQNVFAKLITAIEKYEERAVPFAAWIMRVARNATLDYLRSRRQIPVEELRASDPGDAGLEFERHQVSKRRSQPSPRSNAKCSSCDTWPASRPRRSPSGWGRLKAQYMGCTIADERRSGRR